MFTRYLCAAIPSLAPLSGPLFPAVNGPNPIRGLPAGSLRHHPANVAVAAICNLAIRTAARRKGSKMPRHTVQNGPEKDKATALAMQNLTAQDSAQIDPRPNV